VLRPESGPLAPLAARMRPRTLDEVLGQDHLIGERGVLRRTLARKHLPSMILWGPPGVGKTTIGRLLAEVVGAHLATLSAVTSGVADVRALIAQARDRVEASLGATVLFIDEIHRFNKAQQDALLPHVEDGTITLIGATTENPYFEVNSALLSRMRVLRLDPLEDPEIEQLVRRAIADEERGLGERVSLPDDALAHLVSLSGGDARTALNVLEAAASLAEGREGRQGSPDGPVSVRLDEIETAAQQRVLAYDRAGDGHYDTVSAFIKSIRGNDPDAALYWLAAMVAAGEDPRFIARRLLIAASEDVGNADPRGLTIAVAAAEAVDRVGLPEAQYALAQATTYLASAPKSNRAGVAYWSALADVDEHGSLPVPLNLRNAGHRRMKSHGIGVGYRYPHDHPDAHVEQQYLPDRLAAMGRRYYEPSEHGYESRIRARLAWLRGAAGGQGEESGSDEQATPHGRDGKDGPPGQS
jgi:putative ATPase